MQRDRILFGAKQSVYNLVVEYFHLFRHGLRTLRQVNRTQIAQGTEAQQQLVFLRYSLSPNVSIGDRYGVDAIVEQWQRYSSYFRDLHFQLEHMDEIVKNLAVVAASLSVTITEASLQNVFPHLLGEYGDTGNASEITATSLGRKLLGRRLLLPCSLYFERDEVSSHVVRLEMTVDFLTPISRVLGSITDAAFVLSQALITRDCAIGKFDM
ncbi:WD repeat-containing protein 43 [Phytophthora nicotianae]|nr:WD repeat-containing protein 43 [Phytophthora nicotianae]